MTPLQRLLATWCVIFISLAAGWLVQRAGRKNLLPVGSAGLDRLRKRLQTFAAFGLLPFSAMLSLWGLPNPEADLLGLPLLGLVSYISGGAFALLCARFLKLDRKQTGSFFCCGTFTNIGAVGGLVCLLFLGENSIALVALYRLLDEFYFFSVAMPVSERFAKMKPEKFSWRSVRVHPALLCAVGALALGLALNYAGSPRPDFCSPLASGSMLAATVFFLFAIGLALRVSRVRGCLRECLTMCGIKFLAVPAIVAPLACCMGYAGFQGGLPLKTAVVLSSMPVAMTALVPPSLCGLDVDLANSCWIATTAGLVLALPALALLLPNL